MVVRVVVVVGVVLVVSVLVGVVEVVDVGVVVGVSVAVDVTLKVAVVLGDDVRVDPTHPAKSPPSRDAATMLSSAPAVAPQLVASYSRPSNPQLTSSASPSGPRYSCTAAFRASAVAVHALVSVDISRSTCFPPTAVHPTLPA